MAKKEEVYLQVEKSGPVLPDESYVQIAIQGVEGALGEIHEDQVDDVIKAINNSSVKTKVPSQLIRNN